MTFLYFLSETSPITKNIEHATESHHPWLIEQVYQLSHLTEKQLPPNLIFTLISALFCIIVLKLLMGKPSVDNPSYGQQIIEIVVLQIRGMVNEAMGPYGFKYLSFLLPLAFFILISNLMGLFPLFEPPTNTFSTTLALGLLSFLYYMGMGFRQQGFRYLKHFMGGLDSGFFAIIGILIFVIEIFSNCLRPLTLGFRLMINLFADEKVSEAFATMVPYGLVVPSILMLLGLFVALVQTFVFTQLSIVYLSETVPHHATEEGHDH